MEEREIKRKLNRKLEDRFSNKTCEQMVNKCDKDTGRWSQMVSCRFCQKQEGWTEKISNSRERSEELCSIRNRLENCGLFVESITLNSFFASYRD